MTKFSNIEETIEIPKDVQVTLEGKKIKVTGPKGELNRDFSHAKSIEMLKEDDKITLNVNYPNKKKRALIYTLKSHINNMFNGITKGPYVIRMKIVYAHFPISVKVKEQKVFIENFLGERKPRVAKIFGNTVVTIETDDVIVKSNNIEEAGQTAANIQKTTKIKHKDPRAFQDGIYKYQKFLGDKLIWKLKF